MDKDSEHLSIVNSRVEYHGHVDIQKISIANQEHKGIAA